MKKKPAFSKKQKKKRSAGVKQELGFSLLVIESDAQKATAIKRSLAGIKQVSISLHHEHTLAEGLAYLKENRVDVILTGLFLSDSREIETFIELNAKKKKTPIVVLVDEKHRAWALEAVRRGAQDYILKNKINGDILFRTLHNAIERYQAQERLYQTTLELNAFFQAFPDLFLRVTENDVILDYHAGRSADLFALPLDFLGKSVKEVFPSPASQLLEKTLSDARNNRSVTAVEFFIKKKDVEKWYEARLLPLVESQIMMVIREITERKRLEHLRDEFVSTVSHELRTPITIMKEAVLQVTEGMLGDLTSDQRDNLKTALEGTDRLRRLIDDLLDLSKLEAGRMQFHREKIDMGEVAEGVLASFLPQAKNKGLELNVIKPDKQAYVYAGKDKIIQILVNLVGNAIKFTDKGSIQIHISDPGSNVECSVEDTGTGIPKENLAKIFDKFYQFSRRKDSGEKGTGLGLSLSKALVEMHDGKIWVESEPGKGCRFIFRLPAYSSFEIFKQHLMDHVKEAVHEESSVVAARVWIRNFAVFSSALGFTERLALREKLESWARETLRRRGDMAIAIGSEEERTFRNQGPQICFMFPQASKSDSSAILNRVLQHLRESLSREMLGRESAKAAPELECVISSYPEDGSSTDELIEKLLR